MIVAFLAVFAGIVSIGALVAFVHFAALGSGAPAGAPSFFATLPGLLLLAGMSTGWILVVTFVAARLSRQPVARRLGLAGTPVVDSLTWTVALVGGLALSQAVDFALRLSGIGRGFSLDHMLEILRQARGPWLALTVLVVGVGAGLAEELFFRGYAQRRLVARFGGAAGVIATAGLFALAHLDPQHSVFAFLFGLYVGAVALWSGSTWPAIAIHAANNAAAVLLVASGGDAAEGTVSPGTLLALFVVFAGIAVAALAFVRRRLVSA